MPLHGQIMLTAGSIEIIDNFQVSENETCKAVAFVVAADGPLAEVFGPLVITAPVSEDIAQTLAEKLSGKPASKLVVTNQMPPGAL